MNETIIICAFRYALGRRTYVVSEIVKYILDHWNEFSDERKEFFKREIRKHKEEHGNLGMEMDEKQWQRILDRGEIKWPGGNELYTHEGMSGHFWMINGEQIECKGCGICEQNERLEF